MHETQMVLKAATCRFFGFLDIAPLMVTKNIRHLALAVLFVVGIIVPIAGTAC